MAQSKDPFANVKLSEQVGLDQRLFEQPQPKRPDNRPEVETDVRTSVPKGERSKGQKVEGSEGQRNEGRKERESVRTRVSSGTGHVVVKRQVERRPYDFYIDQVRWLNRKKLDLEEQYGQRVTANAMVQLAVDLLIADFEERGEDSKLIRTLIKRERPSVRTYGRKEGHDNR